MPFKVVHLYSMPQFPINEEPFKKIGAEFTRVFCKTEEEIVAATRNADAIIGSATDQHYSRKVIQQLTKCRVIACMGIGYENLDVQAATDHGICCCNVPDYCLDEVADTTMGLILACNRRFYILNDAFKEGSLWGTNVEGRKLMQGMHRLNEQTLGLVGFGSIARNLTPKAKAFGLKIIAYDPFVTDEIMTSLGVEKVNFDKLLEESDFISIHAAYTAESHHMFGPDQFKKMKPTAYLINAARGGFVDNDALCSALTQGSITGAGLDAVEGEPPGPDNPNLNPNTPLFKLDNTIVTGHSAYYSEEGEVEFWKRPSEEVVTVLNGGWPRGFINPQVKERFMERWGPPAASQHQ